MWHIVCGGGPHVPPSARGAGTRPVSVLYARQAPGSPEMPLRQALSLVAQLTAS